MKHFNLITVTLFFIVWTTYPSCNTNSCNITSCNTGSSSTIGNAADNTDLIVGQTRKIKIYNNSNQQLTATHNVPEYSQVLIETTKLPELQTILHSGILNNSAQEILDAVKLGANVNLEIDGKLPIFIAISLKKINAIEVLKKIGAVIPSLDNMMYRAIINDNPDQIRYAVNSGANVNSLGKAIPWAKNNAIVALLECGAVPSFDHVEQSIKVGDIKSALLLLKNLPKHARDSRKFKQNILHSKDIFQYVVSELDPFAIFELQLEFLQLLIDYGYNINGSSYTNPSIYSDQSPASAWVNAIESPFYSDKILELLMKNGANPNQCIYDGGTIWHPLFIAIQSNNTRAVKFLLNAGADINLIGGPSVRGNARSTSTSKQNPLGYAQALKNYHGQQNDEIINILSRHKPLFTR